MLKITVIKDSYKQDLKATTWEEKAIIPVRTATEKAWTYTCEVGHPTVVALLSGCGEAGGQPHTAVLSEKKKYTEPVTSREVIHLAEFLPFFKGETTFWVSDALPLQQAPSREVSILKWISSIWGDFFSF